MSQWPSPVTITVADHELFLTALTLVVTIVAPTEGATVTSAAVNVTWTFTPGTQATKRVRVWDNPATSGAPVYDSGSIADAVQAHTIPDGALLSGETYYMIVEIVTTTGQPGASAVRSFDTLFTPSTPVLAGLSARVLGDNCDTRDVAELPRVEIRWTPPVPAVDETFSRYSLWRRTVGDRFLGPVLGAWERIQSLTPLATAVAIDANVSAYTSYQYAVTWTAIDTLGQTLVSLRQDPPALVRPEFDWVYIHVVDDLSKWFTFYSFDWSVDGPTEEAEFIRLWERPQPTKFTGGAFWSRITIRGLAERHRGPVWAGAKGLLDAERSTASPLVVRIGVDGSRYFCGTAALRKSGSQAVSTPTVDFIETRYRETVD
jgi:hypothetical protein